MSLQIRVEQLLHGYDRGHRLLASSVRLPPRADRAALGLSDLSGRVGSARFQSYVTGYALPETPFYAFARTWLAEEMPRPGSVWTHTLLLDDEALQAIDDVRRVTQRFVRPAGDRDFDAYTRAIELELRASPARSVEIDGLLAEQLVASVYGSSVRPVVVRGEPTPAIEATLLGLWSQLWPTARRNVSFCSRAVTVRTVEGSPLTVQISPVASLSSPAGQPSDGDGSSGAGDHRVWASQLADDLKVIGTTRLRGFMREYVEPNAEPTAAVPVIRLLHEVDSHDAQRIAAALALDFPTSQSGRELKTALLGPNATSSVESDAEMLVAILENAQAFDARSLQISSRVARVLRSGGQHGSMLLKAISGAATTALGRTALQSLTPAAAEPHLGALTDEDFIALATLNPRLVSSPASWIDRDIDKLFDAVRSSELSDLDRRSVARGLVASTQEPPISVDQVWTVALTAAALESTQSLPPSWDNILRSGSIQALSEVKRPKAPQLRRLIRLLDPTDPQLVSLGPRPWAGLVAQGTDALAGDIAAASFLLTLGWLMPNGEQLVVASAPMVHDALARGPIDSASWQRLDRILPRAWWWETWDECKRLRRGLDDIGRDRSWEQAGRLAWALEEAEGGRRHKGRRQKPPKVG
jgi:hypothetical protein